jgi:hypothetical protein
MNGTLFGESLWDCGSHVIAVRLDDYPIRQCIHEQVTLQRDEVQGELNLDSTQRPLQRAFLIPPVLPVVLIRGLIAPSLAPVPLDDEVTAIRQRLLKTVPEPADLPRGRPARRAKDRRHPL